MTAPRRGRPLVGSGELVLSLVGSGPGGRRVALALAAGGFLYVALADLVPPLRTRLDQEAMRDQILPLLIGVALIWAVGWLGR